jgi:hypothetical protein
MIEINRINIIWIKHHFSTSMFHTTAFFLFCQEDLPVRGFFLFIDFKNKHLCKKCK